MAGGRLGTAEEPLGLQSGKEGSTVWGEFFGKQNLNQNSGEHGSVLGTKSSSPQAPAY
jgi:hypothetical protein